STSESVSGTSMSFSWHSSSSPSRSCVYGNPSERQHRLEGLLDRMLGVKAKDGISDSLDGKQGSRGKQIVAREPKQNAWDVVRLGHHAANGRPSDSAA